MVPRTFHVENFGCRAARADGEAVAARMYAAGWEGAALPEAAVIVVNTCSVTAEADREARAFIRRAHRLNPAARIVATGCYAQRAGRELAEIAGVSAVVGNSHKALVPAVALGVEAGTLVSVQALLRGQAPVLADDRFAHSFLEEAQVAPGVQTRPNLKIQEGCGNRCSFCVIPATRGPSRSLPAGVVLDQVNGFVEAGGRELVFSGINLGRWGRDPGAPTCPAGSPGRTPRSLAGLLRLVFAETALARLRLSSIEPMDWDEELIGLCAEFGGSRLARHAHLPLQSGSDAVLRRMHRRYRPWHYAEKLRLLRRAMGPDLTVGADVMAGFPGETEAEFGETLGLIRRLPLGYLHLFPFSPRPGTRAWQLHQERPVAAAVVAERMGELRRLAGERLKAHRASFVGRELEAITLHTPATVAARGSTLALTENFLPVEVAGRRSANRLVRVFVEQINDDGELKAAEQVLAVSR